jgi:chromosome segregation ATPase
MSSVGNGSVSSKSSTTHKFSAQLKDLLEAAKRVLGREKDIDNLDQILDEKRKLEGKLKLRDAEVKAKDKEIASLQSAKIHEVSELKSSKETLFREFQERFTTWDTGTTKQKELERQVADLKADLKRATKRADSTRNDLADLQKDFVKSKGALKDTTEKLDKVTKDLRSKERELTGALKNLEHFQEDKALLGLEDLDHDNLFANH